MAAFTQPCYRLTFLGIQLQCKTKETALFGPEPQQGWATVLHRHLAAGTCVCRTEGQVRGDSTPPPPGYLHTEMQTFCWLFSSFPLFYISVWAIYI